MKSVSFQFFLSRSRFLPSLFFCAIFAVLKLQKLGDALFLFESMIIILKEKIRKEKLKDYVK